MTLRIIWIKLSQLPHHLSPRLTDKTCRFTESVWIDRTQPITFETQRRRTMGIVLKGWLILLVPVTMVSGVFAIDHPREQVIKIVSQIRRADYEGDRTTLKPLHQNLAPFVDDKELASRVHYWRGFALWRRVINGFYDDLDPMELQEDLTQAVDEFEKAIEKDAGFV